MQLSLVSTTKLSSIVLTTSFFEQNWQYDILCLLDSVVLTATILQQNLSCCLITKIHKKNYQNLLLNFIQWLNEKYQMKACSNIEHHVHECQHVCTCSMSVDLLFIMLSSIRQDLLIGSIFNLVWTSSALSNNTCIYKWPRMPKLCWEDGLHWILCTALLKIHI